MKAKQRKTRKTISLSSSLSRNSPFSPSLLPLLLLLLPSPSPPTSPSLSSPCSFVLSISFSDIRRIHSVSSRVNERRRYVESIRSRIRERGRREGGERERGRRVGGNSFEDLYEVRGREFSLANEWRTTKTTTTTTPITTTKQRRRQSAPSSSSSSSSRAQNDELKSTPRFAALGFHGDGADSSTRFHGDGRMEADASVTGFEAETEEGALEEDPAEQREAEEQQHADRDQEQRLQEQQQSEEQRQQTFHEIEKEGIEDNEVDSDQDTYQRLQHLQHYSQNHHQQQHHRQQQQNFDVEKLENRVEPLQHHRHHPRDGGAAFDANVISNANAISEANVISNANAISEANDVDADVVDFARTNAKMKYTLAATKRNDVSPQVSTSRTRGEMVRRRIASMKETCDQALGWINLFRRDMQGMRMDFMVMKSGLQVLEERRQGANAKHLKQDVANLWAKVEKVEEDILKKSEKMDKLDYRLHETERQFSLLSRRISETRAEVSRQEEFCHVTGVRLNDKYSGIEKDVQAIKDVVYHKLKLDNYVPNFANRVEDDELELPLQSDEPHPGASLPLPPPQDGSIPKDCSDIVNGVSGVYYIRPRGVPGPFLAFCEFESEQGWTVIQRRRNFDQDFDLSWESYKWGFGRLTQDHWLGNEYLHLISRQGDYKLHIDIQLKNKTWIWAEYHPFQVDDESKGFELRVGNYSGNAGNALHLPLSTRVSSKAMKFTTNDRDNDHWPWNCANKFGGGWWYQACSAAYLNSNWPLNRRWLDHFGLSRTLMRIRRLRLHKA